MKLRTSLAAGLAVAALAFASGTWHSRAQSSGNPPERLNYQGFLVDGNGLALGNSAPKNYDVIFRIFNHETADASGNLLWAEQQTVTVDKGYFSVLLGEGASTGEPRPLLSTLFKGATASDRYVGITVKGIGPGGSNVDILPRLRLLSSPYAFLAQNAVRLVQDTGADLITSFGNAVTVSGPLAANSFAGNGASLDSLNAGNLASGTLPDGRLSANVALRDGGNTFSGYQEIRNDLRIGAVTTAVGAGGWGDRLHFSGSSPLDNSWNSDNSDPLFLARFNRGANVSELRMAIGDDPANGSDRLVIGTIAGSTWTPQYAFRANGALEFRPDIAKEVSAGQIGYQIHSGNSLDIVGAGTTGQNRRVQIWAEGGLHVNGPLSNGLYVDTIWGRTCEVFGQVLRMYEASNKSQFFQLYRYPNGVAIQGFGGGWGNASGDFRQITWDGDGNWDVASDRRLKKDIVDAEPMLDRALKIQLRRFRWKDDPADAKQVLGVVAQELQPLFPDLIAEQQDPTTKEPTLAVGYSDFGMIAVKALQELKAQQDAEIADLKGQMAELKTQMAELLRVNAQLLQQAEKVSTSTASLR